MHSDYSLLRSLIRVEDIVLHAIAQGNTHAAICDEGNLFGVIPFVRACKQHNVTPVIGCEFAIAPRGRHEKSKQEAKTPQHTIHLIAKTNEGFKNLSLLSSYAYIEGFYYHPRIDDALIKKYNHGLFCIQGATRSDIGIALRNNQHAYAKERLQFYIDTYGKDSVYLALSNNGTAERIALNNHLEKLADEYEVQTTICNEAYYAKEEDADAHDILIRIGQNRKKEDRSILFPSREFYLKPREVIEEEFSESLQAMHTTVHIAQQCKTTFEPLPPQLPEYEIPEGFSDAGAYLRHLTYEGLEKKYPDITPNLQKRADFELDTIISMGFVGYFLIIWDFVHFAIEHDIPVGPGRGSGAGSLVAYALSITNIDPIRYGLLFERFLNPDRVSMPDFDIDFCIDGRPEIIQYITERYGTENVGQIITFGTMKARAALKDVARVLNLPFSEVNTLAGHIPYFLDTSLVELFQEHSVLQKYYNEDTTYRECVDIAQKLIGLNRHASTHPAGIIIGKKPIIEYLPLYREPRSGSIATQYSMDALEEFGLIKMDILGLKTLTVIHNAEQTIRHYHPTFSMESIDLTDTATFAMLQEGNSQAIFQLESAGMQQILRRTLPERIEDITAINALYRPGPMQFIDLYITNKKKGHSLEYLLPEVQSILEETYGIIVYQEQVIQIVQHIGGFSLGEADIMRRVMGKKKREELEEIRQKFVDGAHKQGYTKDRAERIFDIIEPFAGYGFNKSHAAAYALLAFQTAYLKTHYPAPFFAAYLNCEYKFPDSFMSFIETIQNMKITLIPPDINKSKVYFTVKDQKEILFGLIGIKTVAEAVSEAIVTARADHPFTSINDFLTRVNLTIVRKTSIASLIRAGVFDSIHTNRKMLFLQLETLYAHAQQQKKLQEAGQFTLFDPQETEFASFNEDLPDWSLEERLHDEKQFLQFYASGNPLSNYSVSESRINQRQYSSSQREFIGVYQEKSRYTTRRKEEIVSASLETSLGHKQLRIFAQEHKKYAAHLVDGKVIHVSVTQDSRDAHLYNVGSIQRAIPNEELAIEKIHVRISDVHNPKHSAMQLRTFIKNNPGFSSVYVHPSHTDEEELLVCSPQLQLSPRSTVLEELKKFPFITDVWCS